MATKRVKQILVVVTEDGDDVIAGNVDDLGMADVSDGDVVHIYEYTGSKVYRTTPSLEPIPTRKRR